MAFDYYAAGSESEAAVRANLDAFGRYQLLPRILRDVSNVDTSATLLGRRAEMPVLVAPMAMHGLAHEDKEPGTARAAAAAGVPMVRQGGLGEGGEKRKASTDVLIRPPTPRPR